MVARLVPVPGFAAVAVHECTLQACQEWLTREDQIDANALTLVEPARRVVVIGEQTVGIGIQVPEGVGQAPFLDRRKRSSFRIGHVGRAVEGLAVPHIVVLGRNVEVAQQRKRLLRIMVRVEVCTQASEPFELVVVVLVVDLSTIRDVQRRNPNAATRCPDGPSFFVLVGTVFEVLDHIVEADAAEDGNAIPAPLAVVDAFVAEGGEGVGRKRVLGKFGLLHAHHIGLQALKPFLDPRQAGVERVHIPAGDPHRRRAYRRPIPLDRPGHYRCRVAKDSTRRLTDWNWLRGEVTSAIDAFVGQLDGLSGREQVPNLEWTVAELTAHLASLPQLYEQQDAIGEAFEPPSDWAQFSIDARSHIATDDLPEVAGVLRASMASFLDRVEDPDRTRWLYGQRTTDRNVAGAFLVELIMHGQDLGRLTGAKPRLTRAHAHAGLPNVMAIAPSFIDADKARSVAGTYHLGFRGDGGDWAYVISPAGALAVSEGRPARADARMNADPAAFLLVSLGRLNPYLAALKGQSIAYGRKPWKLKALGEVAVEGV